MKKLYVIISVVSTIAVLFAAIAVISITLGVVLSKDDSSTNNPGDSPNLYDPSLITNNGYMTNEMDNFEVVKSVPFNGKKPQIYKMKYSKYPHFGNTETFTDQEKIDITAENTLIWDDTIKMIQNGTFGRMDPTLGGEKQFESSGINWDVPRVTIKYEVFPKVSGQRLVATAFPGEVVTLTFPKDLEIKTNRLVVCMGKCNLDGNRQNVDSRLFKNDRMPSESREFPLTEADLDTNRQFKVGSIFGGGVYLKTQLDFQSAEPFFVEISNVGEAPIINYNVTTNAEWKKIKMLGSVGEVRTPGVRLILTSKNMREVQDAEFVAEYWHRAVHIGLLFTPTTNMYPISMCFDQKIEFGEAVAFIAAWFCQLPVYWEEPVVNKQLMYNQLLWGPMHELNHHYEGSISGREGRWGMGQLETNNNVINAVFHIEYSNVAGNRENGINDWGYISDGYWTMKKVFEGSRDAIYLRSYVSPAFSFGTEAVKRMIDNYYYMYFDEGYGTKFNKFRNDTGIYCLLVARATESDTRYFCKIFGWEIDAEIAKYIQSFKYKTWFPFYNLYSHSWNGNKYGRVFHVPYKIKTRLDFNEKTAFDRNATNVKFEILDGFKKGKLEEISSGIYDYTADFKPNETDTFKVKMTFNVNGESGSIVFDGELVTNNKMKQVDVYTLETKPSNMAKAEEMIIGKSVDFTRISKSSAIQTFNDKV
ncbi:antigenic protein P1, putative, partial [Entamoeba invadens IP1]